MLSLCLSLLQCPKDRCGIPVCQDLWRDVNSLLCSQDWNGVPSSRPSLLSLPAWEDTFCLSLLIVAAMDKWEWCKQHSHCSSWARWLARRSLIGPPRVATHNKSEKSACPLGTGHWAVPSTVQSSDNLTQVASVPINQSKTCILNYTVGNKSAQTGLRLRCL